MTQFGESNLTLCHSETIYRRGICFWSHHSRFLARYRRASEWQIL